MLLYYQHTGYIARSSHRQGGQHHHPLSRVVMGNYNVLTQFHAVKRSSTASERWWRQCRSAQFNLKYLDEMGASQKEE